MIKKKHGNFFKNWLCPNFSSCPKNLSCLRFGGWGVLQPPSSPRPVRLCNSLAAWWSFRHAELTAHDSWRRGASPNPANWVWVYVFPFLSFLFLSYFYHFSWSIEHTTKTREVRRDAERRQSAVCFIRFLDYRLMFDPGRSFSLRYDLIRWPH